jgi:hypothetical protein
MAGDPVLPTAVPGTFQRQDRSISFGPRPLGQFLGPLRDASGKPIEIDSVWALQFGHGQVAGPPGNNGTVNQLFFTAGPNNYANGLFGVITFGQ